MKTDCKVSVIAPVYNSANFIDDFFDCVLQQTYQNLEVILIDDCSKDDTAERILAKQKIDSRIILLQNEQNMGAARSRNKGIKAATGSYVMFVDSDDIIPLNAVELLLQKAVPANADLAIAYMGFFLPGQNQVNAQHYQGRNRTYMQDYPVYEIHENTVSLFELTTNTPCSKLYKRTLFSENQLEFTYYPYSEDMPFAYRVMLSCDRVVYVDAMLYYYRQDRPGSQSSFQHKGPSLIIEILQEIHESLVRKHESQAMEQAFCKFALHRIYWSLHDSPEEYRQELYEKAEKYLEDILDENALQNGLNAEILTGIQKKEVARDYGKLLADYRIKHNLNARFTAFLANKGKLTDYVYDDTLLTVKQMRMILYSVVSLKLHNKFRRVTIQK